MTRSLSRWQSVLLGLVVAAGLALGVAGLFAVGSRVWGGRGDLIVLANFADIKGVEIGARVRIRGIDAGEVVAIVTPDSDKEPVALKLRVKSEYRKLVYASSTVLIVSEGMLGSKYVEIRAPAARPGEPPDTTPAGDNVVLDGEASKEVNDVLAEVSQALEGVRGGNGTIGKLISDPALYDDLVGLARTGRDAVEKGKAAITDIQRSADAAKRLPFVGSRIDDPVRTLLRKDRESRHKVFAERDLFEAGGAILTPVGREKVEAVIDEFGGLRQSGSEVVIVAYADPAKYEASAARNLTRLQSDAVARHITFKTKSWRKWNVYPKTLGMGTDPPPQGLERSPPSRIEVIQFLPPA